VDRIAAGRRLDPPGFAQPWRRWAAGTLVAVVLWVGVFAPLGQLGMATEIDYSRLRPAQLFLLHAVFVLCLAGWYVLGFAGAAGPEARPALSWRAQLGLRAAAPGRELGLGLLAGLAAWALVIAALLALAGIVYLIGGEDALPKTPPAAIPWIAGLPAGLRVLLSLSAGAVEETFFRGFLQPRAGILLSTCFFALAHLSYEQPFMLFGVTLLSLLFALLVRWRQSILAAIAAHAAFDAVQLLIVVPWALKMLQGGAAESVL
jgi:membrane protease YdiL (CAAX protease family)